MIHKIDQILQIYKNMIINESNRMHCGQLRTGALLTNIIFKSKLLLTDLWDKNKTFWPGSNTLNIYNQTLNIDAFWNSNNVYIFKELNAASTSFLSMVKLDIFDGDYWLSYFCASGNHKMYNYIHSSIKLAIYTILFRRY